MSHESKSSQTESDEDREILSFSDVQSSQISVVKGYNNIWRKLTETHCMNFQDSFREDRDSITSFLAEFIVVYRSHTEVLDRFDSELRRDDDHRFPLPGSLARFRSTLDVTAPVKRWAEKVLTARTDTEYDVRIKKLYDIVSDLGKIDNLT